MTSETQDLGIAGLAALVFSSALVVVGVFSLSLDLPQIAAAFAGKPGAQLIPWIGSIAAPSFAVASPVAGLLVDRIGYRRVYVAALILFVCAGSAPMVLDDLRAVLACRVLLGISVAGALTAALSKIGRLPADRRPALFGYQGVAGGLTAVAVFPIVGWLARQGWHVPFAVNLVGLVFLPVVLSLPREEDAYPTARRIPAWNPGLFSGVSATLCLFAATIGLLMFVDNQVSPFYLMSIGIKDPSLASIPLAASSTAAIAGSALYGVVHRRLGTAWTFIAVGLVIAFGLMLCGTANSLPTFTIALIVMGAALAVSLANLNTGAVETGTQTAGKSLGAIVGATYLAPVILPLIVGPLQRQLGPGGPYLFFAPVALAWSAWFLARVARARVRGRARSIPS